MTQIPAQKQASLDVEQSSRIPFAARQPRDIVSAARERAPPCKSQPRPRALAQPGVCSSRSTSSNLGEWRRGIPSGPCARVAARIAQRGCARACRLTPVTARRCVAAMKVVPCLWIVMADGKATQANTMPATAMAVDAATRVGAPAETPAEITAETTAETHATGPPRRRAMRRSLRIPCQARRPLRVAPTRTAGRSARTTSSTTASALRGVLRATCVRRSRIPRSG